MKEKLTPKVSGRGEIEEKSTLESPREKRNEGEMKEKLTPEVSGRGEMEEKLTLGSPRERRNGGEIAF